MNQHTKSEGFRPSRRALLAGGGSLALGFSLFGDTAVGQAPPVNTALIGSLRQHPKISAWLRINADRTVTLLVGKVEIGQGILTAVVQLCADELDVDIGRVKLISGDTKLVPNEGVTAGSFSMPNCGMAVRQVSAEARAILVKLAADRLGVEAGQLKVADGVVSGAGKSVSYWELVQGRELEVEATGKVAIKPAVERKYAGKSVPRLDLPAKFTGAPIFIQDYRPAGMVHGRVVRPPSYEAKFVSLDASAIEKMPGVLKVVRDGRFIGVIASEEEQAVNAAQALKSAVKWDVPTGGVTHETIYDWLQSAPFRDIVIKDAALPATAPQPARTFEQVYKRPYHMHGSIGPSTALATANADGTYTVQTHSQSVFETGRAIAMMLGLQPAQVHCQHMQGSGCYGHNGADDVAADAALLARALPGRPVRVQWSRQDEHKWEPYGSAMVMKVRAGLDGAGNVLDWNFELWSTPHGTRPSGQAGNLLPARHLEKPFEMPVPGNGGGPNYAADRNAIALYEFPGHKVTTHFITQMPARVSSTRGLGAFANVFAIECFIDELAIEAKADPVEYRLRFLKDPRARDVLARAAEAFGWSKWEKRPDRGRGIAFAQYKNLAAYTAVAIEASVDRSTGAIKVHRAVAANDSGELVSPDGVTNQIEGGIVQSLSWTLKEQVKFDNSGVRSVDWEYYPILTFSETPPIEVVNIDRPGAPFLGTGEASQGPAAAALANAVFDAVGVRYREPPFLPDRIKAGLKA
jgi:nicotinate dehydrogenase subunit B